jgi:hypothetical protein
LDLEITNLYTATLDTIPGIIVNQPVRRISTEQFNYAIEQLHQLRDAGVISESDSPWRSNVVLVPKPAGVGDVRSNTKADKQLNKSMKHMRICLDFRDLNSCLIFPKNIFFVTLDKLLYTLKNKIVISADISSAFFCIGIKEEDRYKTAFWCNEKVFQFNALVMGLKSSPYHLTKFLELAFSDSVFNKCKEHMSKQELDLLPKSFACCLINYFDDIFLYGDSYEQVLAVLKIFLIACRNAKIKISIEKTVFLTTKFKVLGYVYDTKKSYLNMDTIKASGFINLKKPSSLYELHSRLAAFNYQSQFLPYLKHVMYPLQFLLRQKNFRWTEIEEMSWKSILELCTLNLHLVIPDPVDDLVLTSDASKVACSASLFRVKGKQLELVSTQ